MSRAGISRVSFFKRISFTGLSAFVLSAPSSALAQGYSTDVEVVRPTFSYKGLPGIDTPVMAAQPTMRTGFMAQYERDPVILYQFGEELGGEGNGAVVKHRTAMTLGVSYDFTPAVSARFILPTALHSGSDIPELEADGFALEDMSLGVRFRAFQVGGLTLGARADFTLPTGTKESFHGEDGLRTGAGVLAMFETGPLSVLFDSNVMTRTAVELDEDWTHGSQLAVNAGVRYWVLPDRIALWVAEISRGGFNNFYKGGAENVVEMIGGLEYQPVNYLRLHLGGGSGLADGTGGTAQRILMSAKFVPIPPPRPDFVVEAEEELATEPPPDVAIEEILTVEKKWKEGELARVEDEAIVIRDPIQFEFNTANILRQSLPTLHFVAKLMNQHARLGHVVIEGHASEEGTYIYNYDLSIRRARSIWEEVITAGVHPSRLSYRGMGEVDPRKKGTDEAALAKNRRVDFHIIHRYNELDVLPDYPEDIRLPWNGKPVKVKTPADIEQKMRDDALRQRQQRDLEGLQKDNSDAAISPVIVPDEDEEPTERMEESDDDAAPEDPSEDPVEVDEAPAPVQEEPPPVQEEPPPVQEEPAPVQEEPAPVQEEPAPVQEEPAPVQEEPPPVQEEPPPVQTESEPTQEVQTPSETGGTVDEPGGAE
jgi:outer membrane protein OmpA-like peptidoglycan-associated protein